MYIVERIWMRKTKEEAAVTRKVLLDAALRVFSRQGYELTRLEDIAQEAGVTRGAIYHHFGSKSQLYNTLLGERFQRADIMLQQVLEAEGTPLQILRRIMIRSLEFLEEDVEYREVLELVSFKVGMTPEIAEGFEIKKQRFRDLTDQVAAAVELGIESGEIQPDKNVRDTALAILGLMNGVTLLWLTDRTMFSLRERAEGIVDTFIAGLAV
jgi:TetR/AcrR family acrAB operon transcriptional repressor